ncbi:hypothetical protein HMPREF1863_01093 [Aedoeadaptatus coxii]|uniref:Uncharacterized protein n=1 Tax=Aedoeadaptatus coxii TaxID=755172 RepID=A0A134AF81_9FIRM|nr:hypothetical protein HMPREF1863_01093 [Peptoniphilus coxii]
MKKSDRLGRRILPIESPYRALLLEILGMRPTSIATPIRCANLAPIGLGLHNGLSGLYG